MLNTMQQELQFSLLCRAIGRYLWWTKVDQKIVITEHQHSRIKYSIKTGAIRSCPSSSGALINLSPHHIYVNLEAVQSPVSLLRGNKALTSFDLVYWNHEMFS